MTAHATGAGKLYAALHQRYRRIRFGEPIVVVSGLPRSGTSMMMQMLQAGGVQPLSDEIREADESNPRGYFELEKVKELDKGGDLSWLAGARGRAVKIITYLLQYLPGSYNYRVIFMNRDLQEVLASQAKMLTRLGVSQDADEERLLGQIRSHLAATRRLLNNTRAFDVLDLNYEAIVEDPMREGSKVAAFLGASVDVQRMATVVRPELYRNRL